MVVQTTKNTGQEKRSEETEPGKNIVEKLRGHCFFKKTRFGKPSSVH